MHLWYRRGTPKTKAAAFEDPSYILFLQALAAAATAELHEAPIVFVISYVFLWLIMKALQFCKVSLVFSAQSALFVWEEFFHINECYSSQPKNCECIAVYYKHRAMLVIIIISCLQLALINEIGIQKGRRVWFLCELSKNWYDIQLLNSSNPIEKIILVPVEYWTYDMWRDSLVVSVLVRGRLLGLTSFHTKALFPSAGKGTGIGEELCPCSPAGAGSQQLFVWCVCACVCECVYMSTCMD